MFVPGPCCLFNSTVFPVKGPVDCNRSCNSVIGRVKYTVKRRVIVFQPPAQRIVTYSLRFFYLSTRTDKFKYGMFCLIR